MAARLAPDNVRRMHQSLHHVVADAPWSDEAVLDRCLDFVLPAMLRQGPVVAWVVDDTGFPKKGKESVGVARQYCGQVGKQDNCRVAVSLSVTTDKASMPVAYRSVFAGGWIKDGERRKKTGVPEEIQFQTKPDIALEQIRRARQRGIPQGVVLADAGYGNDTEFPPGSDQDGNDVCHGSAKHGNGLETGRGAQAGTTLSGHRTSAQTAATRPETSTDFSQRTRPVPTSRSWKKVTWRQGVKKKLQSRFAAVRVRPAHRDYWRAEPHPEEWLLIEWPAGESEPTKYWLSTLPANVALEELVHLAKHRWIIERDYQELKQELGLGSLRRARLAGFSSSRHPLYRGLWIPGGRTESFFPLSTPRQSWITSAPAAAGLPARGAPRSARAA